VTQPVDTENALNAIRVEAIGIGVDPCIKKELRVASVI